MDFQLFSVFFNKLFCNLFGIYKLIEYQITNLILLLLLLLLIFLLLLLLLILIFLLLLLLLLLENKK